MSGTLVRYGAMAAMRYRRPIMRAYRRRSAYGLAARAAGVAWRNRRGIRAGFKRGRKAVLARKAKRQRFSTTNVGESVGTSSAKRVIQINSDPVAKNTRELNVVDLTDIPHSTDNSINARQRNVVNVRGVKLCMEVSNSNGAPLYFNMAILSAKDGVAGIQTANFFRASTGERAVDFDQTLTGLEFHCLPINVDKYTVLKHKRFRLIGTSQASFTERTGKSYMNLDFYMKLNRQLRWDQTSGIQPISGGVFLVYWADLFQASGGDTPVTGTYSITQRHITYFKEPCC